MTTDLLHPLCRAFHEMGAEASPGQWEALFADITHACAAAYPAAGEGDLAAETALHQVLYSLYAGRVLPPWEHGWKNFDDFRFDQVRQMIEATWVADERRRHAAVLAALPAASDFPAWAEAYCQTDRSNVSHPLFGFLSERATQAQLREFLFQETPFDIHFGDMLAMMLPGVSGWAKAELSKNFWDEMGHGVPAAMHRELRLKMTRALGLEDTLYLRPARFCVAELRLANMYFHAVSNRALLPQALGMMLATELMVPGRLDQQIRGWRRVGWPEASMRYLLEHVVVDVEHAHGWLEEVVKPLLARCPQLISDVAFGMARRLHHAAAVCDYMVEHLPTVATPVRADAPTLDSATT
jgi:pyrroloquinoline quinone (PQQ) biosynthesis protein C